MSLILIVLGCLLLLSGLFGLAVLATVEDYQEYRKAGRCVHGGRFPGCVECSPPKGGV